LISSLRNWLTLTPGTYKRDSTENCFLKETFDADKLIENLELVIKVTDQPNARGMS
jgi:hypothetical protein